MKIKVDEDIFLERFRGLLHKEQSTQIYFGGR